MSYMSLSVLFHLIVNRQRTFNCLLYTNITSEFKGLEEPVLTRSKTTNKTSEQCVKSV